MKVLNQPTKGTCVYRGTCACCKSELEATARELTDRVDAVPIREPKYGGFEVDCVTCGMRVRLDQMHFVASPQP